MKLPYITGILLCLLATCHLGNSLLPTLNKTVIEISLYCDMQLSTALQGDSNLIRQYWGAAFSDINLKMQGIQDKNMSLQVNSISILTPSEEQQIFKQLRSIDGTMPSEQLLKSFSGWLYEKVISENFPKFDVAVLAVSSMLTDSMAKSNIKGACLMDTSRRQVLSSMVISMSEPKLGYSITHELSYLISTLDANNAGSCEVFGAKDDSLTGSGKHELQHYVFTPCSQTSITEFLNLEQSNCLRNVHENVSAIMDTSNQTSLINNFGRISLDQQCQVLLGNTKAYASREEHECVNINCHLEISPGLFSTPVQFDAFDGTPCGSENKMHCIFGKCIPIGGRLLNVATDKCFYNENPFVWNESANLYDCNPGSPLNSISIEPLAGGYVMIKSLDFSSAEYEFGSKCLVIRENENVKYEKCDPESEDFSWKRDFVAKSFQNNFEKFALVHVKSKQCLRVEENSTNLEAKDCSVGDNRQMWIFMENAKLPHTLECIGDENDKDCQTNATSGFNWKTFFIIIASLISVLAILVIIWKVRAWVKPAVNQVV